MDTSILHDLLAKYWALADIRFGAQFQTYHSRIVHHVLTDQGEFIVKVDSSASSNEVLQRTSSVFDFLATQGFVHIPQLLRTCKGENYVQIQANVLWVMESIPRSESNAQAWHKAGQAAAVLNGYKNFPIPFAVSVEGALNELQDWIQDRPYRREFLTIVENVRPVQNEQCRGLIHGEINKSNFRSRGDGSLVFLDWDEAGTGPLALESGYPLIVAFIASHDLSFEKELAQAFYSGYFGGRTISDIEAQALFNGALFHALRSMTFAETDARWTRVEWALAHKEDLLSVICCTSRISPS